MFILIPRFFFQRTFLVLFSSILLSQCTTEQEQLRTVDCMVDQHLRFQPDSNLDSLEQIDGWKRLDAGRMLIKEFVLPVYSQQPNVALSLTLRSDGDPWDKSGAVFIFPGGYPSPGLDLELESNRMHDEAYPGIILDQIKSSETYAPPLELLRFITPFGVGHYSKMERLDVYRPVYIPKWEDSSHWSVDVTHLLPMLEGAITLGVYIDTWSAEGYVLDLQLRYTPTTAKVHPKRAVQILPLVNTTKFGSEQHPYDGFTHSPLTVPFELERDASHATLYYTATGHGGHSEGDEFVPCEHRLMWDGLPLETFTPWRDDCASFRRFNPSSGVWTERAFWQGDSIDERIASSDFSRSGWCPGSQVDPQTIPIGPLMAGKHELQIDVPTAQSFSDTAMNFWNVAAYLTWEEIEQ